MPLAVDEAETQALAAEVWETVLKSVANALQRKREKIPLQAPSPPGAASPP
jgi:hypothetical protein